MSESRWLIQRGAEVHKVDEARLRRWIDAGELAGDEPVRLEGEPDAAWRPLHDEPIFQAATGLPAEGGRRLASSRRLRGWWAHAGSFVAVGFFLGFPRWMIFWAVPLALHAHRTWQARRPPAAPAAPAPVAPLPQHPLAATFLAEWQRLEPLLASADATTRGQLERARQQGAALVGALVELDAHLGGEDPATLNAGLTDFEAELDAPDLDPMSREALERRRDALHERLRSLQGLQERARHARLAVETAIDDLRAARLRLAGNALPAAPAGVAPDLRAADEAAREIDAARRSV